MEGRLKDLDILREIVCTLGWEEVGQNMWSKSAVGSSRMERVSWSHVMTCERVRIERLADIYARVFSAQYQPVAGGMVDEADARAEPNMVLGEQAEDVRDADSRIEALEREVAKYVKQVEDLNYIVQGESKPGGVGTVLERLGYHDEWLRHLDELLNRKVKELVHRCETTWNKGRIDELERSIEALHAMITHKDPSCTCDEIGDSKCPVHFRECDLQNRAIKAENEVAQLRADYDLLFESHRQGADKYVELERNYLAMERSLARQIETTEKLKRARTENARGREYRTQMEDSLRRLRRGLGVTFRLYVVGTLMEALDKLGDRIDEILLGDEDEG
jgi:cell division septum initiation protein DivIVA